MNKSESAFPLLAAQLRSSDEAFCRWAVTGLENLGTKSARQALYQARSNGQIPLARHQSRVGVA